jgi:hypothetical protein
MCSATLKMQAISMLFPIHVISVVWNVKIFFSMNMFVDM